MKAKSDTRGEAMIGTRKTISIGGRLAALLGVAVVVAACGGGSSSSKTSSAAASSYGATTSAASVGTTKGSLGTYLVGSSGRSLYIWVADSGGKSACSGACASAWPPLTTKAQPTATGGASASDLGMITRSDGTEQVTYKGHPLYYYAGDNSAGATNGQGSNQFGARWWLISPSGGQVSKSSTSSSTSGSTGSSSRYSSGGWG
jgi:predicted lipoprotein with Yx(FWY)xxD motif